MDGSTKYYLKCPVKNSKLNLINSQDQFTGKCEGSETCQRPVTLQCNQQNPACGELYRVKNPASLQRNCKENWELERKPIQQRLHTYATNYNVCLI